MSSASSALVERFGGRNLIRLRRRELVNLSADDLRVHTSQRRRSGHEEDGLVDVDPPAELAWISAEQVHLWRATVSSGGLGEHSGTAPRESASVDDRVACMGLASWLRLGERECAHFCAECLGLENPQRGEMVAALERCVSARMIAFGTLRMRFDAMRYDHNTVVRSFRLRPDASEAVNRAFCETSGPLRELNFSTEGWQMVTGLRPFDAELFYRNVRDDSYPRHGGGEEGMAESGDITSDRRRMH